MKKKICNDCDCFLGVCPDLYTQQDMQKLATAMTPGQAKLINIERITASFAKFTRRVRQNMHVIVCMNMIGVYFIHLCLSEINLMQSKVFLSIKKEKKIKPKHSVL